MEKVCLNIRGRLVRWEEPELMAIINMTPDSFAVSCRSISADEALQTAGKALEEGAAILDIGGMSTRPGAEDVSVEEEWRRVATALVPIRQNYPEAILSVDTFRPEVARRAIEEGVDIINDVYGGSDEMTKVLAHARVPYILTSPVGARETLPYLAGRLENLHRAGVADVIIDPGFGFGKTLEENYSLLRNMRELEVLGCPILVGVSRKSMIYRTLGCTPAEALNGTTALHMAALERGASFLRVHDVKEAKEAIYVWNRIWN